MPVGHKNLSLGFESNPCLEWQHWIQKEEPSPVSITKTRPQNPIDLGYLRTILAKSWCSVLEFALDRRATHLWVRMCHSTFLGWISAEASLWKLVVRSAGFRASFRLTALTRLFYNSSNSLFIEATSLCRCRMFINYILYKKYATASLFGGFANCSPQFLCLWLWISYTHDTCCWSLVYSVLENQGLRPSCHLFSFKSRRGWGM